MSPELRGVLAAILICLLICNWPRRKRQWREAQRETVAEQRRRNFKLRSPRRLDRDEP